MRDPIEEDEYDRDRRVDEAEREARWAAFIQIVLSFAETEDWPGVLQAVSRAMRDGE